MTWTVIISLTLFSLFKIVVTCLPTGVVEWILKKFELHSKVNCENSTVFSNGKIIEGKEKMQIIHSFNEGTFLEKHYIWPGTEEHYLVRDDIGPPVIIKVNEGKKMVKVSLFLYKDRVDVVKEYKKKILSYSLLSDLQIKAFVIEKG